MREERRENADVEYMEGENGGGGGKREERGEWTPCETWPLKVVVNG